MIDFIKTFIVSMFGGMSLTDISALILIVYFFGKGLFAIIKGVIHNVK